MIWQAPWAWLGLATLAIPFAVHLLTRRQARRVPFPTLRFLGKSESLAIRRHRLTDAALLAVRAAVIVSAVAALAQPYARLPARAELQTSTLSRAMIVDASASMRRPAGQGTALAAARIASNALQPAASTTSTIESADLRASLATANAWLASAPGRLEVVILSDFQQGAIEASDLEVLPAATGVRLVKIETSEEPLVNGPAAQLSGRRVVPQILAGDRWLDVRWLSTPDAAGAPDGLTILHGPSEQLASAATLEATRTVGVPDASPERPVVIVLPEAAERASLLSRSHPIDQPWMFDVVLRLNVTQEGPLASTRSAVVLGQATLLIFPVSSEPVALAQVLTGVLGATAMTAPLGELEPMSIPDVALGQWERPSSAPAPATRVPEGASDGRWFWLVGLLLLGVETWMRSPGTPLKGERVRG